MISPALNVSSNRPEYLRFDVLLWLSRLWGGKEMLGRCGSQGMVLIRNRKCIALLDPPRPPHGSGQVKQCTDPGPIVG